MCFSPVFIFLKKVLKTEWSSKFLTKEKCTSPFHF